MIKALCRGSGIKYGHLSIKAKRAHGTQRHSVFRRDYATEEAEKAETEKIDVNAEPPPKPEEAPEDESVLPSEAKKDKFEWVTPTDTISAEEFDEPEYPTQLQLSMKFHYTDLLVTELKFQREASPNTIQAFAEKNYEIERKQVDQITKSFAKDYGLSPKVVTEMLDSVALEAKGDIDKAIQMFSEKLFPLKEDNVPEMESAEAFIEHLEDVFKENKLKPDRVAAFWKNGKQFAATHIRGSDAFENLRSSYSQVLLHAAASGTISVHEAEILAHRPTGEDKEHVDKIMKNPSEYLSLEYGVTPEMIQEAFGRLTAEQKSVLDDSSKERHERNLEDRAEDWKDKLAADIRKVFNQHKRALRYSYNNFPKTDKAPGFGELSSRTKDEFFDRAMSLKSKVAKKHELDQAIIVLSPEQRLVLRKLGIKNGRLPQTLEEDVAVRVMLLNSPLTSAEKRILGPEVLDRLQIYASI